MQVSQCRLLQIPQDNYQMEKQRGRTCQPLISFFCLSTICHVLCHQGFEGNVFGFQGSDDVEEGVPLRDALKIYVYDVEEPVPGSSPVKFVEILWVRILVLEFFEQEYPELRTLARGASFCRLTLMTFSSCSLYYYSF